MTPWVWVLLSSITASCDVTSLTPLSLINPLTLRSDCNSPYCQPYNSCNVSPENLVLDQLIDPKLIFFFILFTYLVDIVFTL